MSVKVLFVCLGNICRSPTAEGVFLKLVAEAGLSKRIEVDSAGTAGWHQGRAPDPRTIAVAKEHGYNLSMLRARQVLAADFEKYDYILAMDSENLRNLTQLKPIAHTGFLGLFLAFGLQKNYCEVPDPYHGDAKDFALVVSLAEDAARGLLDHICKNHNLN
ncbi:MAG: low molecular weight protein-tyrosine-phosphatase [Pseudomonadota bacterium]